MRALFLDFDGVLHPAGGVPGYTLPFEWPPLLSDILSSGPHIALVIHSSWAERYSFEELREFLGPLAVKLVGAVGSGPKAEAITAFLRGSPDIDSWLVIDDCPNEFPSTFVGSIAVCDPATGLFDSSVQDRIRRWISAGM